jgi:hypothetical protein
MTPAVNNGIRLGERWLPPLAKVQLTLSWHHLPAERFPAGGSSSLNDLDPSAGRIDRPKRMRYAEQQWTGNFTTRAIMFLNQVRMMRKYGFFHRNPVPAECTPPPEI